jgi:hypothetical protein
MAAPCSGGRPWKPLKSVATRPGQAALIRMFVPENGRAYCTVTALRKDLDGASAAMIGPISMSGPVVTHIAWPPHSRSLALAGLIRTATQL